MAMRKQQLWFIIPLLVFLVAIGLFYTRLGKDTTVVTNTSLNRPLPSFSLPDLTNPSQMLNQSQLPKQPFLLNVWASWCVTCKIEHPFLLQMSKAGVPIVGVNYKDEAKDALAYLNEHQDPFAINVQDKDGKLGIDLGLTGVPESFVVDSQGKIRQHILGEINEERYNKQVLPCLTALRDNADEAKVKGVCQ
ncbi:MULTISPECIES: DsbE family thiol:disulfide interchange protein [unclassified Moraxella]|uniref:DsbE family thiol:disulfide interchange protein n=1 Tax=unclassified Moraxella TaxID=2685852 RepID=UPI003AF4749D